MRDAAEWTGSVDRPMTASLTPADADAASQLAYAADGDDADPYAGFEARIVPENITLLPKSAEQDQRRRTPGTSALVVGEEGRVGAAILRDSGASPDDIAR